MSFNSDVAIGAANNLILQRRREREEDDKQAAKAVRDNANTGGSTNTAEGSNGEATEEQVN